jgi:hypothetical protein
MLWVYCVGRLKQRLDRNFPIFFVHFEFQMLLRYLNLRCIAQFGPMCLWNNLWICELGVRCSLLAVTMFFS